MKKALCSLVVATTGLMGISQLEESVQGQTFPTEGLVSYWKFDEINSGVTAIDSRDGNLGLFSGGVEWTTGKTNSGIILDGTSGFINVANSSNLNMGTNGWSFSGWVYPTVLAGPGADNVIVSKRPFITGGEDGYSMDIVSGNYLVIQYGNTHNFPRQFTANQWHHLVGTYNNTNGHIGAWVNGVSLVKESGGSPEPNQNQSNSYDLRFGTRSTTGLGWFKGKMDEFGIWNRVLSNNEIFELYNQGNGLPYNSTPTPPSLNISMGVPINDVPQINVVVYAPNTKMLALQKSSTLTDTNWQDSINYTPACAGTTTFSFPVTESNAFYRVIQRE